MVVIQYGYAIFDKTRYKEIAYSTFPKKIKSINS